MNFWIWFCDIWIETDYSILDYYSLKFEHANAIIILKSQIFLFLSTPSNPSGVKRYLKLGGQVVVDAAEIRDHETDLVSGPFSWFQSRQIFRETHETEAKPFLSSLSS
jgi:hypothetical protein